MRARLLSYPAYMSSGVPWLGDVPAHWEVRRIKTIFREVDERAGDVPGELLSLTRAHGLIPQVEASNRIASVEDLSSYKICRPGFMVMNRMQAWSGMFAVSTREGLISPDYCIFGLADSFEVTYFEYLFKTSLMVGQFAQKSKGIGSGFNRLYTDDFGSIPSFVPPPSEQAGIVRYLDHADRRIRHYITAKQKLIALLEEEKQAIVNQAVTRGLDPNVPLKPSGVEWLGDVPAHWVVSALKWYSRCHSGNGLPTEEVSSEPVAARRTPVIGGNGLMGFADRGNCQGSVLAIGRVGALCGNVHMVERPTWITDNALMLSLHAESISVKYLATVLKARNLNDIARQTAQPLITGTQVLNERIPVPSLPEQNAIVEYLDNATTNIESVIARARRQIELVQEYRTRLIADVVTGKLDVREAAANLPEGAGEAESIDEEAMRPDSMDGDPFEESQPTEEEIEIEREVTV